MKIEINIGIFENVYVDLSILINELSLASITQRTILERNNCIFLIFI